MTRSGWTRLQWVFLFVGIICFTSCAPQRQSVDRRAAYASSRAIHDARPILEAQPYLSQFGDIIIPGELYEVGRHTQVMEAGGAKTGFSVYSGRLSKTSAEVFFRGELKKKGWDLVTAFSSRPSTVLLFNRKTRWCVILLDARGPVTDVRIGVSLDLGLAPRLLGQ